MPIGYLDVPTGLELNRKRDLVKAMYQALHDAYPFPDDHRIFVREWPLDDVSQNGLLGSEPPRPVFLIHAPQGVNVDAKRTMLRALNAAVADAYHLPDFMISSRSIRSSWWHMRETSTLTVNSASKSRRRFTTLSA